MDRVASDLSADADTPLWYRPVFSAMATADAARRGARLLRYISFVVVAAALAGYVILHKQSAPSAETNVPAAQTQAIVANTGAQHKTLKELMSVGGTQKCSFTSDDANTQTEVTFLSTAHTH